MIALIPPRGRFGGSFVVWLAWALAIPVATAAEVHPARGVALDAAQGELREGIRWYSATQLGVEGRGWSDTASPYDRLPARAEAKVPSSVWGLSRHSAGLSVRFGSDATQLQARWVLTSAGLGMPHMPPTGVSGLDLYVREAAGSWRWLAVGQPRAQTNTTTLVQGMPVGWREYLLYLPLYNGTKSLELGVPEGAVLAPGGPRAGAARKPVVFYGTSITHGACASRPGMTHVAILGRRFQFPTLNLGFSGSGRMEPVMAEFLAELDPSVYVLDCLPNMKAAEVMERVAPFVRRLRQDHPLTPIVLVEDRFYPDGFLLEGRRRHNEENHAALRASYETLRREGVKGMYYVPAVDLLGGDGEATVDASHPTDLGFMRQAEVLGRTLRPLLRRAAR